MVRKYKTIKGILRHQIKYNVRSVWTYEDDNFTLADKHLSKKC